MKNNTLDNPNIVFIDGSQYKIGVHDLPFRHNGDSWVKSTKSKSEIKKAIAKKAEEEAKKRINADKIL